MGSVISPNLLVKTASVTPCLPTTKKAKDFLSRNSQSLKLTRYHFSFLNLLFKGLVSLEVRFPSALFTIQMHLQNSRFIR